MDFNDSMHPQFKFAFIGKSKENEIKSKNILKCFEKVSNLNMFIMVPCEGYKKIRSKNQKKSLPSAKRQALDKDDGHGWC